MPDVVERLNAALGGGYARRAHGTHPRRRNPQRRCRRTARPMQTRRLSIDGFRCSLFTRVVAVLALGSQLGCYRTWTEPVAPPPLGDSVTLALERNHIVMVLQPRPESASAVDSVMLKLDRDQTVTLVRPEMEGRWAIWGWTWDSSLRPARTVVTSSGMQTLSGPDSVRVRVPLVRTHRDLDGGKTALLVTGVVLAGVVGAYVLFYSVLNTTLDGIGN